MSESWEPWSPEVGRQVRVRLNAECRTSEAKRDLDGVTATVDMVVSNEEAMRLGFSPGHRFGIACDNGVFGMAAATELEPMP